MSSIEKGEIVIVTVVAGLELRSSGSLRSEQL
jgi:hypothetical protein